MDEQKRKIPGNFLKRNGKIPTKKNCRKFKKATKIQAWSSRQKVIKIFEWTMKQNKGTSITCHKTWQANSPNLKKSWIKFFKDESSTFTQSILTKSSNSKFYGHSFSEWMECQLWRFHIIKLLPDEIWKEGKIARPGTGRKLSSQVIDI